MAPQPLITICITHFNDVEFILNTLYCLQKLTQNPYKVIIRDNNAKKKNYLKLKQGISNYENVELYRAENFKLKGSIGHGTALNDLVEKIDTPFGCLFDADFTFLRKNWDATLMSRLNDKVKIIGTQISRKGVEDFPFMVGMLFETKVLKELNVDFRSRDLEKGEDTGWELRGKYLNAGWEAKVIELKNSRFYKDGPFKDFLGVGEYYLDGDYEHILGSHFSRGSFLGAAKYTKNTSFIYRLPAIGKFFRKQRGKRDKKRWIELCYNIVQKQT
ncbi:MAG: glycosyltransferase [bacterium]|nr:glycosyltransferase [bacterium]